MLGADGDDTAREVLESGALEIEADVSEWEASSGRVHGHRVWAVMPADLLGSVAASLTAQDALSWAIAAAIAERAGEALFDLRYEAGEVPLPAAGGPYR